MAIELSGKDLGVADCDWSARGEAPADVLEQTVEHLGQEHGIELPSAKTIMEGKAAQQPIMEDADEAVRLIVQRVYAELDLPAPPSEPEAPPAVGPVTGR